MQEFIYLILLIFILKLALDLYEKNRKYKKKKQEIEQEYEEQQPEARTHKTFWKENYSFKYDYSYMPYKRAYLLTRKEHIFYITLVKEASKRSLLVCPKVRLEDLVYITDEKHKEKYRGYVKSRHIDFVLLNTNCETVAAIELDDPSHNEIEAQKTDRFKSELFKKIGVPLIRIQTETNYIAQINVAFDKNNLGTAIQQSKAPETQQQPKTP